MKKIISILGLAWLLFSSPCFAEAEKDPLNTLDALNRAIVSIYRVEQIHSKATVDEEYNDIINNIAWGNIAADPELIKLFTDMMDVYTENRLDEKDRQMLRRQYETQVNRAFLEVKPLSHVATEVAADTARDAFNSGSLLAVAGSTASGALEFARALQANERVRQQARNQEQEYMNQRMAGEWDLDKAKIRRFNLLKTSLLNAAWTLLNKYNLPDEGRITEDNLDSFYSFISEKDIPKAIRMGKRLESDFGRYAPFWFYLGTFYMDAGNIAEARKCFEKFEKTNRPISRKDTIAAANARYKLSTLDKSETDEARRLLNIIEKNSANDDWNNILFAALQNYQLGNKQKAEDLLYQNIDNRFNVPLNSEILRQMKNGKLDLNSVQAVAIREFKEPSELEKLAIEGNAAAQFKLGERLLEYNKVKEAVKWLEKAADKGNLLAEARLFLINNCSGKIYNVSGKFDKLDELTDLNSADANFLLGDFCGRGCGIEKDLAKAFELYQKAAEQGLAIAQNSVGFCYLNGLGTQNNPVNAFEYFQKAADQGNAIAQTMLGICYENGLGTQKDLAKAFELYQKAAEQGYAAAQNSLGLHYIEGRGTQKKNPAKAFEWFQKAAKQGLASAQTNLGFCYEEGWGTQKDLAKAFELYQKAAEQGYAAAQNNLGLCYFEGRGTQKNQFKAFEYFQKAADQGYVIAQNSLGYLYYYGKGLPKDMAKAVVCVKFCNFETVT